MVKYYYDKFTVITNTSYLEPTWKYQSSAVRRFEGLYKNYTWDSISGTFSVNAERFESGHIITKGTIGYQLYDGILSRYELTDTDGYTNDENLKSEFYKKFPSEKTQQIAYSKGSLVQTNITAEDGTYPANGRHSDGYWYVKGAVVPPAKMPKGTVTDVGHNLLGNGGRKTALMSNGWIVVVVMSKDYKYLYFYVDKRNGLGYEAFLSVHGKGQNYQDVSIVSVGTTLEILTGWNNTQVRQASVNVTNVPNMYTDIDSLFTTIIHNNLTRIGNVALTVDISTAYLYAAWSCTNGTYADTYNVYYTMTSNRGYTWSSPLSLDATSASGKHRQHPTIIVYKGVPLVIFRLYDGASFVIRAATIKDGSWTFVNIMNGGSIAQNTPSAVVDKNGVIHLVWVPTAFAVYYSKSTDGGLTWTIQTNLTNVTNTYTYSPSITVDKNNTVYVAWSQRTDTVYRDIVVRESNDGLWSTPKKIQPTISTNLDNPSTLYDPNFRVLFGKEAGSIGYPPVAYETSTVSVNFFGDITTNNNPTIAIISPTNNQTLYENDTLNISGNAYDSDKDQSVTAYYQINSEPRKVLATNLSQTQIALSKQLTFKGGKLYDGDTALTGTLADGVAHTLKVWAEDSEKASSAIIERTFYVVPNRAPLLSVDAVVPSGVVDADKFKISGTASDQDANSTVKVTRRINAGNAVEIYSGAGGAWEFELALSQLVVGKNTIVIEVIDNYGAKASKTITLNKNELKTPILQSVARYKITPPAGSAKGVLLFIERDEALNLKVELSMTLSGEQEQYETLTASNTAPMPNTNNIVEDTYYHEKTEPKDNIILKLSTTRPDATVNHKIHLISGAVE